nr:site-specific integrase [Actinopolyspora mortivallis]
MPRKKNTRNASGRSTIYEGKDGWHGYVTVGKKDNGKPDRRHVRGKTQEEVSEKVRRLEREREEGKVRKTGESWRVHQWLNHWLHNIVAPPAITANAWDAYDNAVRVHLIPGIGSHWLTQLEPEHLERLYRNMMKSGASSGNAHQVHRTIRAALNEAVKRKHIKENPAKTAKAPKVEETEVEPYSVEEVKSILTTAKLRRNSSRWAIALALGLRQGEVLGLQWSDIDLEAGTLVVRRNRIRPKWAHGCSQPCGYKHGGALPSEGFSSGRDSKHQIEGWQAWDGTPRRACGATQDAPTGTGRGEVAGWPALAGQRLRVHHTEGSSTQPSH